MATAQLVKTPGPQHYLWWFPGSPVKLHLSLDVVRQIRARLLDAPSDYSEEGLLFGEIHGGVNEIVDFAPATRDDVATSVVTLPPGKSGSLVGYYRTENADALRLNARDRELAKECFAKPFVVFLVINRNRAGLLTATFFFHDRDCRMSELALLEFPFDPSLLAAEQSDRIQRSHEANERPMVVPPPSKSPAVVTMPPATPLVDRPKSRRLPRLALWVALVGSAVVAGFLLNDGSVGQQYANLKHVVSGWLARGSAAPTVPQTGSHPSMSLHAVRQNGDVLLSWNRESNLIASATSGTLSIKDGESMRVLPFDPARLRDGSILYSPKTDQILIQLTVSTAAESHTESVTVILPAGQEARTVSTSPGKTIVSAAIPPLVQPPDAVVKPTKPFVAPALPKEASHPVPKLQDPPAVNTAPASTMPLPNVLSALSNSADGPPAPLPVTTPPRQTPAPAPPAAGTYEPALALVKTQPRIPPELKPLLRKNMTVEVHVTIDKTGKVLHSEAIPQRNVSQALLNAVVDASRSWRFLPAMHNHEPVASESIVQFVFNP